jgi:hypothetical protein
MKVQADNPNQAARNGTQPGVQEAPMPRRGRNALPESAKILPAKFFLAEKPALKTAEPYRPILAQWLTSEKNPFFAKAMVNRTWAQFFGRGLVNPIDDMHDGNPASHPQLLKELSDGFIASGFDLKELIRTICNSETYQRTSKPVKGNEDAEGHFYSRMAVKVLSPEQLYDSLVRIAGNPNRVERQARAQPGQANGPRAQFIAAFQAEDGADPTEYQAGIPQVLRLMNRGEFNTNALANTAKAKTPAEGIEQLYLTILARRPSADEVQKLAAYVSKGDASKAYGDVAWALLNCSEFALNR